MADPQPDPAQVPPSAPLERSPSEIFAAYLTRRADGDPVTPEDLLAAHPEHASALRAHLSDDRYFRDVEGRAGLRPETDPLSYDPAAAARAFAEDVVPGRMLGEFRLVRKLAEGGMGQVWEALQSSLGRPVALKVIRPDRMSRQALERFRREARANARLRHPNIVSIIAHGTTEGVAWLAMELVTGGRTLHALTALDDPSHPITDSYCRAIATVFVGIAEGMAAAHREGIVHRDLKLENVLLDEGDRPRVTDFGLALMEDEAQMSTESALIGTLRYMSPEQLACERDKLDGRSDVFTVGSMLFELLTHQAPFGTKPAEFTVRIQQSPHPDLARLRPGLPKDLALIVDKCLEKQPDRRYASMEQLRDDLQRFLRRERVYALPPVLFDRFQVLAVLIDDDALRVIRCLDRDLQREVILEAPGRSVHRGWHLDGAARAMREAQLLAALQCNGLPQIYDVLRGETGPVLVLESVSGELLASRLARTGPLEPSEVRRIALDLASTLAHVHRARAVHRGLSADCVLLAKSGSTLLSGFRFAKFTTPGYGGSSLTSDRTRARASEELRTLLPRHPAPEQFGGSGADASTDIFALGCVLYEAATGRPAIADHYRPDFEPPPPVRTVARALPTDLADVIDRCLARAPAGRPRSAEEIVKDLDRRGWRSWFGRRNR